MRYVIRPPSIFTTPKLIKQTLGAKRTVTHGNSFRPIDWHRDFFLHYDGDPLNADNTYRKLSNFGRATKAEQRSCLQQSGIPTPTTFTSIGTLVSYLESQDRRIEEVAYYPLVRRPLRHSQGVGYSIIYDPFDWDPSKEYVSELYPKTHEYRIVFSFGTPIITLYKRVPEDVDRTGPWNHSCGSSFVTVNDPNLNRLRHTDAYDKLREFDIIKTAHLCAADILLAKKGQYVVCELNFCPALTIPDNLERLKNHVVSYSRLNQ